MLSFFVAGVDPRQSIDEATERLRGVGFAPVRRWDTERFSAAAYRHDAGRTAVRIATVRGTVLALDGEPGAFDYGLGDVMDFDADGVEDLIVERREPERSCIAIARVDSHGALRFVVTDARGLDPSSCIERLEDVDGDGRLDAVAVHRAGVLGERLGTSPSISEPLCLDARGVLVRRPWPAERGLQERETREMSLTRAEGLERVRLVIELAWLARAQGADAAEVDAILARASAPEHASILAMARHFLLAAVPSPDPFPSASASANE